MARSKSSVRWLQEHFEDEYVKRAQREGYRSRAAYKLLELDAKDQLLKPGRIVVDLGAAPGGWSQVAGTRVGDKGRVFALDILPMDALLGVQFLLGDFREESVMKELLAALDGQPIDLVMSDMAPNISGIDAVDQPASMYLVELALDFAVQTLRRGGEFVAKAFQGEGFDPWHQEVRRRFTKVSVRKPKASRPRSREVYVVAKGFKGA